MMTKVRDGVVFGRWTVIERVGTAPDKAGIWRLRCSCGTEGVRKANVLTNGKSKSCGCYRVDIKTIHGHNPKRGKRSKEYSVWSNMIQRCENPKNRAYANYGGRGVRVCARWRSFDGFLADMGLLPFDGAQIDRINNDLGYSKENCRWVTQQENLKNRRRSGPLPAGGLDRDSA